MLLTCKMVAGFGMLLSSLCLGLLLIPCNENIYSRRIRVKFGTWSWTYLGSEAIFWIKVSYLVEFFLNFSPNKQQAPINYRAAIVTS